MAQQRPLSDEDLRVIRGVVASARAGTVAAKVDLATRLAAVDGLVTLDFAAEGELGAPMVVVRLEPGTRELFHALTPRERQVAACMAEGLRNRQIAERLFISVPTVKDHVHAILAKTGLAGRAAVAATWRP